MSEVTELLNAVARGDVEAGDRLWPHVYGELRQLAAGHMIGERPGLTLDATALVHEAYLRLTGGGPQSFENRRHFFGAASRAMRHILVDNARRKERGKHGGGRQREPVEFGDLPAIETDDELLDLHEALERFAVHDPQKAELVELRFFGGLTLEQAAECLGISPSTADRGWRYARAWLYDAMSGDESPKP